MAATKIKVPMRLSRSGNIEVDGFAGALGLGIHWQRGWRITHLASGLSVQKDLPSYVCAKAICERIAPLASWESNPIAMPARLAMLAKQVKKVVAEEVAANRERNRVAADVFEADDEALGEGRGNER